MMRLDASETPLVSFSAIAAQSYRMAIDGIKYAALEHAVKSNINGTTP
jgi:hypothetical protein